MGFGYRRRHLRVHPQARFCYWSHPGHCEEPKATRQSILSGDTEVLLLWGYRNGLPRHLTMARNDQGVTCNVIGVIGGLADDRDGNDAMKCVNIAAAQFISGLALRVVR